MSTESEGACGVSTGSEGACGVSTGSEGVGCLQGVRVMWGVCRE